ncbi:MAG: LEA type 2 family protein [Flavobacteriales bacterium]|nr:LEA type 2 family protein [Flavobacteriales bacterium]
MLLLVLLLSNCSYKEVVFKGVHEIKVGKFDKAGMEVTATVALDNPNSYSIKVKDPDVDVFLNNLYLGKAHLDRRVVLAARSSEVYTIPLHASFDGGGSNVLAALISTAISGKGELKLKGTVTGGLGPFFRKKFPFEETEMIDLRGN